MVYKSLWLPNKQSEQIIISEKLFPETFSIDRFEVQQLIEYISNLVSLDSSKTKFQLQEDLRDVYGMPFEIEDRLFEIKVDNKIYKTHSK